jgi:hypothetical protein
MPVFHLRIFSREANFSFVFGLSTGTNWIKTKENFASREKIRKWKTGFRSEVFVTISHSEVDEWTGDEC